MKKILMSIPFKKTKNGGGIPIVINVKERWKKKDTKRKLKILTNLNFFKSMTFSVITYIIL
jgi:hypothetical protein